MALEDSVKVDANPEELVEEDDVIYVVCSGYGAGKTLCTINTKTFDKAESIEIVNNPQRIVESDDHIYVLAGSPSYNPANYDYSTAVYTYNPQTKKCDYIANATKMMAYDGNLYFTNSTSSNWVTYTTTYNIYDAKSKQVSTWNLKNIPDEVAGNTVYMIERNPYDGSFYLAYSPDYNSNSIICHFTATGEYKSKFDAGGINANSMLFLR